MTVPIETYSRRQAAALLGICVSMLGKLRARGELVATRIGRRVLYRRSVLERFLDRKTLNVRH